MKKHSLTKIYSTILLVIITLIFIVPVTQAKESEDYATGNKITTFKEASTHADQQVELRDMVDRKKNRDTSPTSPELCVSLNDKLKWFFSFETPNYIDDLYDEKDDFNYRAIVGFHIAL